jgi:hypothetical protein
MVEFRRSKYIARTKLASHQVMVDWWNM